MISIALRGRFGNHLFQYVVGRIIADKNNTDFCMPNSGKISNTPNEDKKFLGTKVFNCYTGAPFKKQPNVFEERDSGFDNRFTDLKNGTHIKGFFQSEQYFEGYEDKIREWLKPDEASLGSNICTIHFRAKDGYLREKYVLPKAYFDKAKELVLSENENVKFVVLTDNPSLAKNYFPDDEIVMKTMKHDFELIYHSKYKIISNSTFSWWAAWLNLPNSQLIIAPDRWLNYNHNSTKENIFHPKDIKTENFVYI